jgi:hypothetical protein
MKNISILFIKLGRGIAKSHFVFLKVFNHGASMKTQLDNVVFLKIPNEEKFKPEAAPSTDLSGKARLLWEKTLEAGERESRLSLFQRTKQIVWDYNLGAATGWFRGMTKGLKDLLNPTSGFYNTDYQEILQDIQQLPETAIDHGIHYMDEDWRGRGELNAQKGIQGGMWLLKVYLGSKVLGETIIRGTKKLFPLLSK